MVERWNYRVRDAVETEDGLSVLLVTMHMLTGRGWKNNVGEVNERGG